MLTELSIQFQGGFSSETVSIYVYNQTKALLGEFVKYPDDTNLKQKFDVNCTEFAHSINLVFQKCRDTCERVTIYHLELFGVFQ